MEDNFSMDWRDGGCFEVIQAHYIYCWLCFYDYYIVTYNEIIIQLTVVQKLTGGRAQAVTRAMGALHRWSSPPSLAAQLLLREIGGGLKTLQVHSGGITNSLSVEVSTGEGNGTPLLTVAWKVPWTEEPGGLQSMGSLGVGHNWATTFSLFTFMHWRRKWQPTPVFLPGESQGRGSLVGCRLWGRTESGTTAAT